MSITQKNVFGDNIVYALESRELTDEIKTEILSAITTFSANSAVIRFENGGETREFSELVGNYLAEKGIVIRYLPVLMSEISRGELSIHKHPSDPNYVIIKVGPIQ